jgi:hypothetical protein
MTERDPVELDVNAWADYWASVKVDAVLVSVTGILAFYPTQVPYHRRGKFLGNRDYFGDCAKAAKQRGIRVIARMSPDLQWEEALAAHPEWFERNRAGKPVAQGEAPGLYRTCMFSPYFTEQIPAIMREVNGRYDVDGIFTNAWPPLGALPVCYCANCQGAGEPGTPEYRERFMERTLMLWKLYDRIAKEKNKDNLYFGNLGSGASAMLDLKRLGDVCWWFNADNQGRGAAGSAWGCTQQGRVANAVMHGRTITNVTGAYATGSPRWRNTAKNPAEAAMWMAQTVASGMVTWYHWIGGQSGLGADRRWLETGRRFLQWHARHERHFVNKRSIANLGVVLGQRTQAFHRPGISDYIQGLYYSLLEGRFLFDFLHEDDLGVERLRKYKALVLPNVALLSDEQCQQLRVYVESGGSLLATFETSLYDERGKARLDFGLNSLFGIHKTGERKGPMGNGSFARVERPHEILRGLEGTKLLPGAEYRIPVEAAGNPVLSSIPAYTAYPPELSYSSASGPDGPAVVLAEKGPSRLVYFPGDIERTAWVSGNTDLSTLLQNAVRWILRGETPVSITGEGVVEAFAWETEPGFAVHVLNYNNPNLHRGWIRQFYPIGQQRVQMDVPGGRRVSRVELLRAERDAPFRQRDGAVEFVIPRVVDYEVAALYVA